MTVVLAVALGAAGCALFPHSAPPPVENGVQAGVASWYGPGFHGNRTANGEVFDQYELTAAHPTLPLGTRAMVTNLSNGRAVEVRINDRGPFVGGRVIDLSYAAARTIGMIGPGTARVRIDVLGMAAAPRLIASAVATVPSTAWLVEVASLSDAAKAAHLRAVLGRRFPDAHVSTLAGEAGPYYRVRIGPYPLRSAALERAERVSRIGYPAVLVEEPR
jgi:peptidoglycan lytic transglycosylase